MTIGAEQTTGTIVLSQPAPAAGAVVTLKSSNLTLVSVPATVTVPAGSTLAQFTATVTPGKTTGGVAVTATSPGGLATGVISLLPNTPLLAFSPSSIPGGGDDRDPHASWSDVSFGHDDLADEQQSCPAFRSGERAAGGGRGNGAVHGERADFHRSKYECHNHGHRERLDDDSRGDSDPDHDHAVCPQPVGR